MKHYSQALIVDDDADLCLLLKAILDGMIPNVKYVHSLEACKKFLTDNKPDVVFLDNNLPDGQGIPFIKELKDLCPGSTVFVISAASNFKEAALHNGADLFLEKPLTPSSIRAALSVSA